MRFLTIILLFISMQVQSGISASVDSKRINFNQSLQFNLSSDNAGGQPLNLTILKRHFRVVGNSKVSRPYLKNGVRKQKTLWFFILRPKISGTLNIPSIKINGEKSRPIKIQVIAPRKPKKSSKPVKEKRKKVLAHDVLIKAIINKSKVFPNEMLIYSLTIDYPQNVYTDFKVETPFVPGAIVLPLAKPSVENVTLRTKARIKRTQSFAIFTDQIALFNIEPVQVHFKSAISPDQAKDILLKANSLHFEVTPKANQTSLGYWLPSDKLELSQQWQAKDSLVQGTTLIRTIKLKVSGVNSDNLPLISTLTHQKANIVLKDVSVENIIENGQLYGQRVEKTEFTFNVAGQVSISPIDIHWWNIKANQARVSSLDAHSFNIKKRPPVVLDSPTIPEEQTQGTESKHLDSKQPLLNTEQAAIIEPAKATKFLTMQQMNWALALLFTLLVATTCGWLFSGKKPKSKL
jgi:hypothetical protein